MISAPAGFGKSTIVAEWVSKTEVPTAWLSLDIEDNDVVIFWSYFIRTLNRIHPQLGKQSLEFLHSSSHPIIEKILTVFINEANHIKHDFAIILDDFHLIKDPTIYRTFKYLLDHLPSHLHIYMISRSNPNLPLASLRAKGELLEITTHDLRFTLKENGEFFNQHLQLNLDKQELLLLNRRIEGWAAGIHMVSLLLLCVPDKTGFIRNFSGDHRYIMDYFIEEILATIPNRVKDFLLHTSVLNKMNSALCNALTDEKDSQEILDWLKQFNLFIIPLDEKGYWYRYHQLFAETLNILLQRKNPDVYIQLHQKASLWFKINDLNSEAINHALEAKNYKMAADWIEQEASKTFKAGELTTLCRWISSLPKDMLYRKPKIWLYYIWALIISVKINEADMASMEMDNFINDSEKASQIENSSILGYIKNELCIVKAQISTIKGENGATERFIQALPKVQRESIPEMITFNTNSVSLLHVDCGFRGKIQSAKYFYISTAPIIKKVGNFPSFAVGFTILSEIHYEQNELEKARNYVKIALELSSNKCDLGIIVPAYIIYSKIKMALGEQYGSLEILDILEGKIKISGSSHWASTLNSHRTRISITMKNAEEVRNWVEICRLSIDDEITILQHYQFTTLIRALLYLDKPSEALLLLERMEVLLEEEGGIGQLIEINILLALCCQALNNKEAALKHLHQALKKGADEGYYRIFIDEGECLFKLLKIFKRQQDLLPREFRCSMVLEYTNKLYEGFIKENRASKDHCNDLSSEITKPLTSREWEVLRLMVAGYSNQAISDSLFISVITCKTHLQNIYRKFGVSSRAQAIARVNEFNLLEVLE